MVNVYLCGKNLSSPLMCTSSKHFNYVWTVLCLCILISSNIPEIYITPYFGYFNGELHVLHNLLPSAPYHFAYGWMFSNMFYNSSPLPYKLLNVAAIRNKADISWNILSLSRCNLGYVFWHTVSILKSPWILHNSLESCRRYSTLYVPSPCGIAKTYSSYFSYSYLYLFSILYLLHLNGPL